jgi:flagellar biosynthetic protein FliR
MTVTVQNYEIFLLILVRITGFIYTAPFFSLKNVPFRVKTGLSICLTILMFYTIPANQPAYHGVIGYAILIVKELVVGVLMGYFSNIAYHILSFAGQMMDTEIGFSMVSEFDPASQVQTTITSNFYGYLVLLIMLITNLHHYFLRALVDSFRVIGVGKAVFHLDIYKLMVHFMTEYFIIGFRIVLPIYVSILIVNTILAILAKVAPQMNMFVIGLQLKVLVGLFALTLIIVLVPSVADFIFNDMIEMLKSIIKMMT